MPCALPMQRHPGVRRDPGRGACLDPACAGMTTTLRTQHVDTREDITRSRAAVCPCLSALETDQFWLLHDFGRAQAKEITGRFFQRHARNAQNHTVDGIPSNSKEKILVG